MACCNSIFVFQDCMMCLIQVMMCLIMYFCVFSVIVEAMLIKIVFYYSEIELNYSEINERFLHLLRQFYNNMTC